MSNHTNQKSDSELSESRHSGSLQADSDAHNHIFNPYGDSTLLHVLNRAYPGQYEIETMDVLTREIFESNDQGEDQLFPDLPDEEVVVTGD